MTPEVLPVAEMASVVLDASGRAVASLGPRRGGIKWLLTNAAVQAGAAVATPKVECRLGTETGPLISFTWDASDSTDLGLTLFCGQSLTFVWSDGTPGTPCTATIYGTQERI